MKTLIVFSTKYGTTEKCAKILKEKLNGDIDLCNLKKTDEVEIFNYDKVIIGGSIYVGQIQKEVKKFCSENLNKLKKKRVGLFICCMNEKSGQEQLNNSFPKELLISAVAKETFGGEFRFSKMNFFEKFIIKTISKKDENMPPIDTKKDISKIVEENINKFVQYIEKN
ncbi:flavodoxin domain-containing protein [Clostridium sediminicola]|uniref:flavodoxin domain-containing protein n=1 Tax=Clostridium sediminicola TaxID=3114879 RepID=UPI0031F2777E